MTTYDKVKIVVVGDSGVGKTCAVHLICHGKPLSNPSWTVGCGMEVRLHEYKTGTPQQKTFFIDLWDIGGSSSHQNSRNVFYNGVNGVILVHDLTNRKSEANLHKWIMEILCGSRTNEEEDFDPEQFVGSTRMPPILILGTKLDAVEGRRPSSYRASSIAEEFRADEVLVNCLDAKYFAPGSTGAAKLSRFLDSAIDARFVREIQITSPLLSDRKRL